MTRIWINLGPVEVSGVLSVDGFGSLTITWTIGGYDSYVTLVAFDGYPGPAAETSRVSTRGLDFVS